jgi:diadenosine tetraphosphate (Ap4A) HIT family hydrolase
MRSQAGWGRAAHALDPPRGFPSNAGMFVLDERLARDSVPVLPKLQVSQLRLMNDARYPWLLLVPEIEGAVDLHDLPADACAALVAEARAASKALAELFGVAKTNVATLGNMVPQLHMHVIGRRHDDPAWPGPVWGVGQAEPYRPDALAERVASLAAALRVPV